jgi:hypothetical protein
MPIRPERKHLYPANWKTEIVPTVRERSGDCCETCGVRNDADIVRSFNKQDWAYLTDGKLPYPTQCYDDVTGAETITDVRFTVWLKPIRIVLTVAHLNHDETDNRPENLRYWCQLHHNRHDAKHRAANAKARREREANKSPAAPAKISR